MTLNFEDDNGKRHFEFCYIGFILGGCLQERKGMQVLRREFSILEKLESISEDKPCGKKMATGEPERQLKNGDSGATLKISIDPSEYDMLQSYIGQVPWQSGSPVKYAIETLDWLERSSKAVV